MMSILGRGPHIEDFLELKISPPLGLCEPKTKSSAVLLKIVHVAASGGFPGYMHNSCWLLL